MMNALPPIRFAPQYKERIWGGQRMRSLLGKDFSPLANCGESWEISAVPGSISVAETAPFAGKSFSELIAEHGAGLCGTQIHSRFGADFPILLKFIDAAEDLSIQVHPDDALARERHASPGKTEMWYVFSAEPGSRLISAFKGHVDQAAYLKALAEDRLSDILESHRVEPGDVFFLPAGRVHAIGKGICLAEIQQTSDVTYRLFDYHRVDAKTGKERELHTEAALAAMDFAPVADARTRYRAQAEASITLARCPYFHTRLAWFTRALERSFPATSCTLYINVGGHAAIDCAGARLDLRFGQCALVPANNPRWTLVPFEETRLLEVRLD